MPPNDAASPDAIAAQLRRLEQKFDELQAAQSAGRSTGRIISALIAIVAIALVARLIDPIYGIYTQRDAYFKVFQKDLTEKTVPVLRTEFEKSLKQLAPAYQKAVETEVGKRADKAERMLAHEYDTFFVNLSDNMTKLLTARMERIVDAQHKRLVKEFPDVATEEGANRTLERIDRSIHQAAERVLDENFKHPIQALMDLNTTFEKFQVPDNIQKMTDAQLDDHVIDCATALLTTKYKAEVEFGKEMSTRALDLVNKRLGEPPATKK